MTLYLDTSSAIKLYVLEAGSDVVHALVDDAAVVATSAITYAETRAGLARLRRDARAHGPEIHCRRSANSSSSGRAS